MCTLFGSHATGTTHPTSDTDIAVELETTDREDPAYNDAFFGLSADLSDALGTDDVYLVDIHTLSPSVAASVFEAGVLRIGDVAHAEDLRQRVTNTDAPDQSPRERFDTALAKIDDHLGGSGVTATDGNDRER
ncbi:nucleotidyltransferase protein [Halogeometricum borinquense DSM 11551]|uniref:Nucleotidyltransferase family protein n=1 Tax=Halogeometricum borinquense (strain ATCC 700274 / DSM 11551 / JCM 10706 / KCTC 4070 / PR3) TaxID=469382 RepID=E4NVB6_HALBP|nr:nucleotidyltransferase domain-containing protein [Halogeometricum borinquense]ADQ69105.1 nucleotidyltransferase family protein [Halogeometricum borinquense DSM 11551]ELY29394.1 nucleotidyltransferase protein [Halogeometricum borinquense DSM 11551]